MKQRTKRFLAIGLVFLLLVFIAVVAVFRTPLGIVLRQNPGYFDRVHLKAVVDQVRVMSIAPDREIQLRLDNPADPKSLRLVKPGETFPRGSGAGCVWAKVNDDKLVVVIETNDLGHAGEYGFAYSDVPLPSRPFGDDWFTIEAPGPINLVQPDMKIDDHWWKVLNNLD